MIHEARCVGESGELHGDGQLQLASGELRFNGPFELRLPLDDVELVRVRRGRLFLTWSRGDVAFDLGRGAADWARMVRAPRGVVDRIGVKPQAHVLVLGIDDLRFRRQLLARTARVTAHPLPAAATRREPFDVLLLAASSPDALHVLTHAAPLLAPGGAVWVICRRPDSDATGRADRTKVRISAAARGAGLMRIKTVRFSATQVAYKFVAAPQAVR